MNLYIVRDGSFTLRDGSPASNLLHYEQFSKRYLEVFDHVYIVGRLFQVEDDTALPVEGEGVSFIALPGRRGLLGAFLSFLSVLFLALKTAKRGNAFLLRIPGTVPTIFYYVLRMRSLPYSVEVAADPEDSYSRASLKGSPISGLAQKFFVHAVSKQCRSAAASLYVTRSALQSKYAPGNESRSFGCTSIDLPLSNFASAAKVHPGAGVFKLVLVGNMESMMKGHDVLLQAMAILISRNVNVELDIIGYGKNRALLEELVSKLNLTNHVRFLGKVRSGGDVYTLVRKADLFVLPSRQEGLPRALIEAMSQGLPAVATNVGGTPELLDDVAIVPRERSDLMASLIEKFVLERDFYEDQAERNLRVASEYSSERVSKVRFAFLSLLKEVSK